MSEVCRQRRSMSGLILLGALLSAGASHAATRRFAVVVAHNRGAEGEPALRFAEADAEKLARVLTDLGGVAPSDLLLLRGRGPESIRAALQSVTGKVRALHAGGADRAVVIFYYSGHSDGEALELGDQRLAFAELRALLSATGAEVRLVLLDSCRSGALLAIKGGEAAPGFQIRLSDEIASSGEALISSSASDEMALESREIRGSFFTHHLVSGLRGAADSSGDGRVTLAEAYEYVFKRTVSATAATTIGPQHPGYTYRLSGEGELVLTDLNVRTSRLTIPSGLDRALIIDGAERVLAEVGPGGAASIALPPGGYVVRAMVGKRAMAVHLHLGDGEQRALSTAELVPSAVESATGKGSFGGDEPVWSLGLGVTQGVAAAVSVQPALRVSRQAGAIGFAVQLASGGDPGLRETSGLASGSWSPWQRSAGRFTALLGPEAGVGGVFQARRSGPMAWSPAAAAGMQASLSVGIKGRSLTVSGHLLAEALQEGGHISIRPMPSAFAGISLW